MGFPSPGFAWPFPWSNLLNDNVLLDSAPDSLGGTGIFHRKIMTIQPRVAGSYKRDGQECLFNFPAQSLEEIWNHLTNTHPGQTISEVKIT